MSGDCVGLAMVSAVGALGLLGWLWLWLTLRDEARREAAYQRDLADRRALASLFVATYRPEEPWGDAAEDYWRRGGQ